MTQQEFQFVTRHMLVSISSSVTTAVEKLDELIHRNMVPGLSPKDIAGLIERAVGGAQQKQIEDLAKRLNSTQEAVIGFLAILKEDQVKSNFTESTHTQFAVAILVWMNSTERQTANTRGCPPAVLGRRIGREELSRSA